MLLGKRSRPPMKRTTSMTEFSLDLINNGEIQPSDAHDPLKRGLDQRFSAAAAVSPRIHHRKSADHIKTAHFLRACSLCNRRLVPGRDIFMYRDDSAFCSLECRQQQMKEDERKEKCSLASKKEAATTTSAAEAEPETSTNGEAVAAFA
ncbi:unnamed protein product [Ilex paraguariensis]|uniref:FLZ-type domain-containing protein n=1 Tax=Ilex paraguariensis TaxID=185542 RepID=A0ABC8SEG4_9AQUA